MVSSVPLIVARAPVPRIGARPQRAREPHRAVVYATREGDLDVLDGGRPMRWLDQMFSRYHMRYEVDMSDHQRTVELRHSPPPSLGGIYSFQATLDVGFRVHDPAAVVRRHVEDALPLLHAHLIHTCHQITSRYRIEDAGLAQQALNQYFANGEVIEGCLFLYKCRARLAPDAAWYRHQREREESRQLNQDKTVEHELNRDDATRDIDIDLIKQRGEILKASNERAALAGRPLDARELIAIALERDPGKVDQLLDKMLELESNARQREDEREDRTERRLQFLAGKELLDKPAASKLVDHAMGQLTGGASAISSSWDAPLPGASAPASQTLMPVYLVVDQSAALHRYTRQLDAGIQSLLDALGAQPEVADAIRLSVLGYSDDVTVALALEKVRAGLRLPPLTPHGDARYGAAFERLLDLIPRDTDLLKRDQFTVVRPQVVFFSGAQPADGRAWSVAHRRLVDQQVHRAAPHIVACGVGETQPSTIAEIATSPELAFVAAGGDVAASIEHFCAFVRQHILGYGRAVLDHESVPPVGTPEGFRLAQDVV